MFLPIAHATTESSTLTNPLSGVPDITTLLYSIVNVVLVFAVPVIVFFIIFAGFSYVTAQGNPEKIKAASQSLIYALIGAVIIVGAGAIIMIVQSIVNAF